jgi:glycosyltransferase involved in cell wall biosynthesis
VGVESPVLSWDELRRTSRLPHYAFLLRVAALVSRHRPKWILTDMHSGFLGIICAEAAEKNVRVAWRLRGDPFDEASDRMRYFASHWRMFSWAAAALARGADRIFFQEPDLHLPSSHWLESQLPPVRRSLVLGLACDTGRFPSREHAGSEQLRLVSNVNFDCEANVAPLRRFILRNADFLLENHISLDVAGSGAGLDDFRLFCDRYRAIRCVNGVDAGEGFYAQYDGVIHFSAAEAYPMCVLEGQASALPVIASAEGGAQEHIEHNRTGFLVDPEDSDEVCSLLMHLRSDPSYRNEIGTAARARVQQTCSKEALGAQLRDALHLENG